MVAINDTPFSSGQRVEINGLVFEIPDGAVSYLMYKEDNNLKRFRERWTTKGRRIR